MPRSTRRSAPWGGSSPVWWPCSDPSHRPPDPTAQRTRQYRTGATVIDEPATGTGTGVRGGTRHVLDIGDLGAGGLAEVLALSELDAGSLPRVLEAQGVALVFEKPSNRTRNSSEMATVALGGHLRAVAGPVRGLLEDQCHPLGLEDPGQAAGIQLRQRQHLRQTTRTEVADVEHMTGAPPHPGAGAGGRFIDHGGPRSVLPGPLRRRVRWTVRGIRTRPPDGRGPSPGCRPPRRSRHPRQAARARISGRRP